MPPYRVVLAALDVTLTHTLYHARQKGRSPPRCRASAKKPADAKPAEDHGVTFRPESKPRCHSTWGGSKDLLHFAGAADEGAAGFEEAERAVDMFGDAYAATCSNLRGVSNGGAEPESAVSTQIESVQAPIDLQCLGKTSGPSRQISEFSGIAKAFHPIDSFQRLDGTQEDACSNPFFFGSDVEHVGRSIDEVDISQSSFSEERMVSGRFPNVGMTAPIARWVGLRLDDATAHPLPAHLAHDGFADEKSGQLSRINRQAGPREPANFVKCGLQWRVLILFTRHTWSRSFYCGVRS